MQRLEGKVAIVTGGGAGIGEAICHTFAKEGAKVVVSGLPSDPIDAVATAITHYDGTAIAYPGDVSEEAFAKGCLEVAPMARRVTPEDIANIYAFLASDEAGYVMGALWLAAGVTPAKGSVGKDTPFWKRSTPNGELRLEHERDGLQNKNTHQVK